MVEPVDPAGQVDIQCIEGGSSGGNGSNLSKDEHPRSTEEDNPHESTEKDVLTEETDEQDEVRGKPPTIVTVVHPQTLTPLPDDSPVPTAFDLCQGGRRGLLDNQLSVSVILLGLASIFPNPAALCCALTAFVFAFKAASANRNDEKDEAARHHRRAQCCNSMAALVLATIGSFFVVLFLTLVIGLLVFLLTPVLLLILVVALAFTCCSFGH